MSKLIIFLVIFTVSCLLGLTSARRAKDFTYSTSRIPLYIQKQMDSPNRNKIVFSKDRMLQSTTPMTILTVSTKPLSLCTIGDDTQTNFGGLHIEIFKAVGAELGWVQGVDYVFSCVSRDTLIARATASNNITAGVGAVTITADRMRSGLKFAQPIAATGMAILMRREDPRNVWSFLLPISWMVGVGLIVITLILAIVIWMFEETKWKRPWRHNVANIAEVMYDMCKSLYYENELELKCLSSKILQWLFWIVLMVFMYIYQAELTSKLSPSYVQRDYKSFEDATSAGKVFATNDYYRTNLQMCVDPSLYNFVYYADSGSVETNVLTMIADLNAYKIDGIVLPQAIVQYYASQYCTIQRLDDLIGEFNYGIVFPPTADPSLVSNVSQAVIKLTETNQLQMIRNKVNLKVINNDCSSTESITVVEVGGLWIILSGAIFISLVMHFLGKFKIFMPDRSHKFPYFTYLTRKTEVFESQLKQAVEFEMDKILETYKEQIMEDIDDYENILMLQKRKHEKIDNNSKEKVKEE